MHVEWPEIINYLKNTCSEEERERIEIWLRSSPDNQKFFEQLAEIWNAVGVNYDKFEPNNSQAWESIVSKLNLNNTGVSNSKSPRSIHKMAFRWAAVFALIVASSLAFFLLVRNNNQPVLIINHQPIVVQAMDTCKALVMLDSSKVWLNKQSRLTYNDSFNLNDRVVNLTGEAYFEITRNAKKPFVVHAFGAIVKVVGTAFNLKTDSVKKEVKLNVISGTVKFFSIKAPEKNIMVQKGERAVYNVATDSIIKTNYNHTNEIAWKTGDFIFENDRLDDVCRMLTGYYNVSIAVSDSSLANMKLSAGYNKQPLKTILQAITATLDLKVDTIGHKIIFKPLGNK
jgi:ferric-dicitrate binding protein FerR (iron transport regulator)